ncbi:unannotated protein [freshwater metagenome]|uniref:Unannotated protein n=1 Tax=freshwater metagenome TaxID=449393 RepID=A0A6J7C7L5_9ZZZZ
MHDYRTEHGGGQRFEQCQCDDGGCVEIPQGESVQRVCPTDRDGPEVDRDPPTVPVQHPAGVVGQQQGSEQHCPAAEHRCHACGAVLACVDERLADGGERRPTQTGAHGERDAGVVDGVGPPGKAEQRDPSHADAGACQPRAGWRATVPESGEHSRQHRARADGRDGADSDTGATDSEEVAKLEDRHSQCSHERDRLAPRREHAPSLPSGDGQQCDATDEETQRTDRIGVGSLRSVDQHRAGGTEQRGRGEDGQNG